MRGSASSKCKNSGILRSEANHWRLKPELSRLQHTWHVKLIFGRASDYSAKISPFFWEFVVGGLLIATVLLLEGGLLDLGPAVLRLRDHWRTAQRK